MLMRSTSTAESARALLPAALALAAAALFSAAAANAQANPGPIHAVLAAADGGLPGDGRPPSPGPTDPDGSSF
jgi:hypothetical protein